MIEIRWWLDHRYQIQDYFMEHKLHNNKSIYSLYTGYIGRTIKSLHINPKKCLIYVIMVSVMPRCVLMSLRSKLCSVIRCLKWENRVTFPSNHCFYFILGNTKNLTQHNRKLFVLVDYMISTEDMGRVYWITDIKSPSDANYFELFGCFLYIITANVYMTRYNIEHRK